MFFELMGTVLAGLATALLVFAIRRFAPDRVPRWLIPAAAGAAMIAAAISNEYGWYERTASRLPAGFEVANTIEEQAVWRPWTYLVPLTSRFVAVDRASVRTNDDVAGQRIVDLYFFGRWTPVHTVPVLFDCNAGRTATLVQDVQFGEDGQVAGADWSPIASDDPVFMTACEDV